MIADAKISPTGPAPRSSASAIEPFAGAELRTPGSGEAVTYESASAAGLHAVLEDAGRASCWCATSFTVQNQARAWLLDGYFFN